MISRWREALRHHCRESREW